MCINWIFIPSLVTTLQHYNKHWISKQISEVYYVAAQNGITSQYLVLNKISAVVAE